MLKVRKTNPYPKYLAQIENAKDDLLHWLEQRPEVRNQERPPINHDLYRSGQAVVSVAGEFGGCCAYCERLIGDKEGIGLYRPISVSENENSYAENYSSRSHYAWLAYEWKNLILICRRCEKERSDRFPLQNGVRARYMATLDETRAIERPLLIDPSLDNPAIHIKYSANGTCRSRNQSTRGEATIALFGLNDPFLVESRQLAIKQTLGDARKSILAGNFIWDFIFEGSHRGASRDVLIQALVGLWPSKVSVNNGNELVKSFTELVRSADSDARRLILDRLNAFESELALFHVVQPRGVYKPQVVLDRFSGNQVMPMSLDLVRGDIAKIEINNFKAISELRIDVPLLRVKKSGASCVVLLGENAVGKSSFLAGVSLALIGTRQVSKLRLKYHEFAHSKGQDEWNLWGKERVEVSLKFFDERQDAVFAYNPKTRRIDGTEQMAKIVLGYGPHRYYQNGKGRGTAQPFQMIRGLFGSLRPLPDPSEWLSSLSRRQFDEVASTIRTILPTGSQDLFVKHPIWGICIVAQGQLTPVMHLSEGYRSVFAMVADMCRSFIEHWSNLESAEGVVLIDEVETHLHPRWKMQVMASLRRAFPQVQFIVTTHDPLCVRGVDSEEVVVLSKDDDGKICRVQDLPDVTGMRADQILTSEYFGLVSTIEPELHLKFAQLADSDSLNIDEEARLLIDRITVGDTATAQIINDALLGYLRERERPVGVLGDSARSAAVRQVLDALKTPRR